MNEDARQNGVFGTALKIVGAGAATYGTGFGVHKLMNSEAMTNKISNKDSLMGSMAKNYQEKVSPKVGKFFFDKSNSDNAAAISKNNKITHNVKDNKEINNFYNSVMNKKAESSNAPKQTKKAVPNYSKTHISAANVGEQTTRVINNGDVGLKMAMSGLKKFKK